MKPLIAKHTPGPWFIFPPHVHRQDVVRFGIETQCVAEAIGNDDTAMANARLMSAAPEMLRALQDIAYMAVAGTGWTREQIEKEARAAIAKATEVPPSA